MIFSLGIKYASFENNLKLIFNNQKRFIKFIIVEKIKIMIIYNEKKCCIWIYLTNNSLKIENVLKFNDENNEFFIKKNSKFKMINA